MAKRGNLGGANTESIVPGTPQESTAASPGPILWPGLHRPPGLPRPEHYFHMIAVGEKASVMCNDLRIVAGLITEIKGFDKNNPVTKFEVEGSKMEQLHQVVEKVVERWYPNGRTDGPELFDRLKYMFELEHSEENEGLICLAYGLGKTVTNFYRRFCGLPLVDVTSPIQDTLRIVGILVEIVIARQNMFLKGGRTQ